MKKLMVVGASILQVPAIRKAKEMGLMVAVADQNPNAVGISLADRFYHVSTIDEAGVCQATEEFGADGLMTLATDMPMRAVAYTCAKLGLVGISYDTAIKTTDKAAMIKAFEAAGVAHPQFFVAEKGVLSAETIASMSYPLITKPTDNAGSRGVMLVNDQQELINALHYSSKNGRKGDVIVEEYMQGPEVSVEVVVYQSIPHILQITDKITTSAPHFVEMGHTQPSRLPAETQAAIRELAGRAVLAVGIQNGPAHVEIIVTKNGPKMVELGARMGGDCITSHLVPLSTGVDMVKACIQIALGEVPDLTPKLNNGSAIRFIGGRQGIIKSIDGVEQARSIAGVQEVTIQCEIGQPLGCIENSTSRSGFVVAMSTTAEKAAALCEQAVQTIKIRV